MYSKSELVYHLLPKIKQDHKIIKLVKGKAAVDSIKKLLFENINSKESIDWAKRWNNYEKSQTRYLYETPLQN